MCSAAGPGPQIALPLGLARAGAKRVRVQIVLFQIALYLATRAAKLGGNVGHCAEVFGEQSGQLIARGGTQAIWAGGRRHAARTVWIGGGRCGGGVCGGACERIGARRGARFGSRLIHLNAGRLVGAQCFV